MAEEKQLKGEAVLDEQGNPITVKVSEQTKGRLIFLQKVGDQYHFRSKEAGQRLTEAEKNRRAEQRKKERERMKDKANRLRKGMRVARDEVRKDPTNWNKARHAAEAALEYELFMADWKNDPERASKARARYQTE